ncbi:recombinase family protein [Vagococcus xieshaowenii]|uniref:Recombinase family protein n=1 Tax=Vagococcus xieshaowenii TaxID=2562451 RepID=A0AAJ5JQ94_9ENTE|nr:recombinase family protein [Vagococcus xieshaowenii]QCA28071.1 recombinase family protein [Vagococcus xieshaowenii]TFZ40114.1 recombinase family protein [Vagococcus xieshaowenii]
MKLYVNEEFKQEVSSDLVKDYEIIVLGPLNQKKNFIELLSKLGDEKDIYIWDYNMLDLNILAFKRLLDSLAEENIALHFINEKEHFMEYLIDICEREKNYLASRTKRGLKKAREKGNFGGRPRVNEEVIEKVKHLYFEKKLTYREIAAQCNVSIGTVHKYSKLLKATQ